MKVFMKKVQHFFSRLAEAARRASERDAMSYNPDCDYNRVACAH